MEHAAATVARKGSKHGAAEPYYHEKELLFLGAPKQRRRSVMSPKKKPFWGKFGFPASTEIFPMQAAATRDQALFSASDRQRAIDLLPKPLICSHHRHRHQSKESITVESTTIDIASDNDKHRPLST